MKLECGIKCVVTIATGRVSTFSTLFKVSVRSANQKLVSFMCGLGLVGGAEAGLSEPAGLSGDAGMSDGDATAERRGETGTCT